MVQVRSYNLPATQRIPNNRYCLIHYCGLLPDPVDRTPEKIYDLFRNNGWNVQWIFRYGKTQKSHYHSRSHETMCVLTGHARIRFGVADTSDDMDENTYGRAREDGGVELEANAGDVFVIPAGVAHKTFDCTPEESFRLLTPGTGRGITAEDEREVLAKVELSGFTMCGAYPPDAVWDFAEGDVDHSDWNLIWAIEKPEKDPVFGLSEKGTHGLW